MPCYAGAQAHGVRVWVLSRLGARFAARLPEAELSAAGCRCRQQQCRFDANHRILFFFMLSSAEKKSQIVAALQQYGQADRAGDGVSLVTIDIAESYLELPIDGKVAAVGSGLHKVPGSSPFKCPLEWKDRPDRQAYRVFKVSTLIQIVQLMMIKIIENREQRDFLLEFQHQGQPPGGAGDLTANSEEGSQGCKFFDLTYDDSDDDVVTADGGPAGPVEGGLMHLSAMAAPRGFLPPSAGATGCNGPPSDGGSQGGPPGISGAQPAVRGSSSPLFTGLLARAGVHAGASRGGGALACGQRPLAGAGARQPSSMPNLNPQPFSPACAGEPSPGMGSPGTCFGYCMHVCDADAPSTAVTRGASAFSVQQTRSV